MKIFSIIRGPRVAGRMATILRKAASHGLGFAIHRLDLGQYLPAWLRIPRETKALLPEELATELASLLEELGPTFVKFGQMLSTRPDVLPAEYISALERMTHQVAPFPGDKALSIVEKDLGRSSDELFRSFSQTPRASGSIAQVHDAVLRDGREVVVKVRRPNIRRIIEDDLAILTFIAAQADRVEEFQSLRLPMLVEEFGRGIQRELDFVAEAAYTHRFRTGLSELEDVEIAAIYWDHTSERVLTMRRLEGEHIGELLSKGRRPARASALARTLMDAYLKQFFVLGVFHGDPHPGNILITPQGKLALLDFGLVGRIGGGLRRRISTCLIALGNEQFELVAEVMAEMGGAYEMAEADLLQDEIVGLLERYSSVPLDKLDFQRSFLDVMDVIRRHNVDVPRDFVLMGRALVTISGIVLQLDPTVNIGALAVPYGRKLLREKATVSGIRDVVTAGSYHVGTLLREGPRELRRVMHRLQKGLFEFTIRHEGFEKGLAELDETGNRLSLSIILAAIIMASTSLLRSEIGAVEIFGSRVSLLGIIGLAFGFVIGAWLVVSILRSRKL